MPGAAQALLDAINASIGAGQPEDGGEFVIIAEIHRYNIVTETEEKLYAATGEFASDPGDTDPDVAYWARLSAPSIKQEIVDQGEFLHTSGNVISRLFLISIDGDLDAEVDNDTYSLKGRAVRLLGGLESWPRSDFVDLPGGRLRILDVLPGEDFTELVVQPLNDRPDRPIQEHYYGGFGAAYEFNATDDTDCDDVFNLGVRDCALQIRFESAGSGSIEVLLAKRSGIAASSGNAGYVILKDASDQLHLYLDDGSNFVDTAIGTAGEYTDSVTHTLTVNISRTGESVDAWVDTTQEVDGDDISSITGRLSNTESLRHGADSAGGNNTAAILDEPRVWYRLLSADEIEALHSFSVDGVEVGLVGAWPYDEYTGNEIKNRVLGPGSVQAGMSLTNFCDMGDVADPGSGSFVLTGWMRGAAGASGVFASRKVATPSANAGYSAELSASSIIFTVSDGSTQRQVTISTHTYDDDTLWGWALVVDRVDDELRCHVLDYPRGTLTSAAPVDITGDGSYGGGTTSFRLGDRADGSGRFTGNLSWIFYGGIGLTDEHVKLFLSEHLADIYEDAPTVPPAIDRLTDGAETHFWPLSENTGTTATDHIGSADGTFNSTPTWVDRDGDLTGAGGAFVTTLEGNYEIKGTPKPVALGRPQRILPVLVDKFFLIYQWSDPALGASQSLDRAMAGAKEIFDPADFSTDLTNSTITLTGALDGVITLEVKGVVESGRWLRFPGEIAEFVWDRMLGFPGDQINEASVEAYDDAHPFQVGIYTGSCEMSLEQLLCLLLAPDGYAYRGLDNQIALASRVDPASLEDNYSEGEAVAANSIVLESKDIARVEPASVPPPSWLVRMGYDRTYHRAESFDAGSTVTDQRDHQQEWRFIEDHRPAVKRRYADAVPRTYLTPYFKTADVALLVQRMLTLDGVERQGWRIYPTTQHLASGISDAVLVKSYSRHNVAAKVFQVLGHDFGVNQGMPQSSLLVWGGHEIEIAPLTPLDLSGTLVAWKETKFGEGDDYELDGAGAVETWHDRGGGTDGVQPSSGRRPALAAGTFGDGSMPGLELSLVGLQSEWIPINGPSASPSTEDLILCFVGRARTGSAPSGSITWGLGTPDTGNDERVSATGTGSGGLVTWRMDGVFNTVSKQIWTTNANRQDPHVILLHGRSNGTSRTWYVYVLNFTETSGVTKNLTLATPYSGTETLAVEYAGREGFNCNSIIAAVYCRTAPAGTWAEPAGDTLDPELDVLMEYFRPYINTS